jgi:hypothetical protein
MLTRRLSFATLIAVVLSIQAIVSLDASAPRSTGFEVTRPSFTTIPTSKNIWR